jgi:hypothetical protein
MFSLQSVLLILSVMLLTIFVMGMLLWSQYRTNLEDLREQLASREELLQKQWNLLLAKDPMTLATMNSINSSEFNDQLTPIGTDAAEAARYMAMYPQLGDALYDDLSDLGLLDPEQESGFIQGNPG